MANYCYNKVIITHNDITKVRDLYRITAGDFFNIILPPPVELCNEDTLRNKEYNMEAFGADNLHDWRTKNWKNGCVPVGDCHIRTLSKCGSILTLGFETKWAPAVGIYDELQRQGYHVKAYFCSFMSNFCGSYIYGIGEWINFSNDCRSIPLDIDLIFNLSEAVKEFYAVQMEDVDDTQDGEDDTDDIKLPPQHDDNIAYFKVIADEMSSQGGR